MLSPPPHSINLTDVARVLHNSREHRQLVDAIALSQTAYAALEDIEQARRVLDIFVDQTPSKGIVDGPEHQDATKAEVLGAMFKISVIAYARATTDGSNTRRKMNFRKMLAGDDSERHQRLIALRDKAIAHTDVTKHFIDGPWYTDNLTILIDQEDADKTIINYAFDSVNYRQNMVTDLSKALPVAEVILKGFRKGLEQTLTEQLLISLRNPEFIKLIRMHPAEIRTSDHYRVALHTAKRRESFDT